MVFLTTRRLATRFAWLRFLVLVPISLLAGHEAVFRVQYAPDAVAAAMRAGGHDAYWQAFSVVIVALTAGLLLRECARIVRLRTRGGDGAGRPAQDLGVRPWTHEFRALWPPLFAATVLAFGVLENMEHLAAGLQPHGIGSLIGPEHPLAVPVLAVASAAVAALGALVRWRVRVLEARVRAGLAATPRIRIRPIAPARDWPAAGSLRSLAWFLVRLRAGRAPPSPLRP
jgi:hypothetical protein